MKIIFPIVNKYFKVFYHLVVVIFTGLSIIGCAPLAEGMGRSVDPGYNRYKSTQSVEEKSRDDRQRDAMQNEYSINKKSEESMKKFDENVELKNQNNNSGTDDSLKILEK